MPDPSEQTDVLTEPSVHDRWVYDVLDFDPVTGSSKPPSRPPPEPPKPDPFREQFGRELIDIEGRLDHFSTLELEDEAVKKGQTDLKAALDQMDKARSERRYKDALDHLHAAAGHADIVERAVDTARKAETDFHREYQKLASRRQPALDAIPPTEWTKKAKADFVKADDLLQQHIAAKAWDEATKQLPKVAQTLDAFDVSAKQELTTKLDLLDKWDEAKDQARTLRGDLAKLTDPIMADRGYHAVANEIGAAAIGWRNVRTHKVEMGKLAAEFAVIAQIPDATAKPVLKPQWDAYTKAKTDCPDPATLATIADHDKLAGQRADYAKAGRALIGAFESGVAGAPADDPYWKAVAQELQKRNTIPLRLAGKVPPLTPEITKLQAELTALNEKRCSTWKEIAENQREVATRAETLIAMRTQPSDPALVDLFKRFRKVENDLKAAAATIPSSGATPEQQEYKRRYDAFLLKLNGKDEDRVAVCGPELAWLAPKADAFLNTATEALKNRSGVLKALPQGTGTQKREKAELTANEINSATPEILARLSTETKLDLLETLRTNGMPAYDKDNPSLRRKAMRKMYHAMTLEEEFAKQEEQTRAKFIDALKAKKQELKDARENWSVMTDEQKVATLKMIAEEQCKQYGFTMPSNGVVVANEPDSSDNGSYSPADLDSDPPVNDPTSDRIKINSAKPVFHDFEAALDLIIHENTHRNQNVLCNALRFPKGASDPKFLTKDNKDPPYTQTRMFNMGNVPGGYVKGAEDYPTYKKQPEEEHAWLAGPRGAQGILDMLGKD